MRPQSRLLSALLPVFVVAAAHAGEQPHGRITHVVGPGNRPGWGSVQEVKPDWRYVEARTESSNPSRVTFGDKEGDSWMVEKMLHFVWTNVEHTKVLNRWQSARPTGWRVYAKIRGKVFIKRPSGGPGKPTQPGPPPRPPVWETNSIDIDLDADSDGSGDVNPGLRHGGDPEEDKIEEANPAPVTFFGDKPHRVVLLRQLLPRLPASFTDNVVTLRRGNDLIDLRVGTPAPTEEEDKKKSVFLQADGSTGLESRNLYAEIKDGELRLRSVARDVALCAVEAEFSNESHELLFVDRVMLSSERIQLGATQGVWAGSLHAGVMVDLFPKLANGARWFRYFPHSCQVNDSHPNVLVLHVKPVRCNVARMYRDIKNGTVQVFETGKAGAMLSADPSDNTLPVWQKKTWTSFVKKTNRWLTALKLPEVTEEKVISSLKSYVGTLDKKYAYVVTLPSRPYVKAERLPFEVRLRGRVAGRSVVDVVTPITLTPESGRPRCDQYKKFEITMYMDPRYFRFPGPGLEVDEEDSFDAYDADEDGVMAIADAVFRQRIRGNGKFDDDRVVPGSEVRVPAYLFRPGLKADGKTPRPFEWRIRFSPPKTTGKNQYWECRVEAMTRHQYKIDATKVGSDKRFVPLFDRQHYDEIEQHAIQIHGKVNTRTWQHRYGFADNQHKQKPYKNLKLPPPVLRFVSTAEASWGPLRTAKGRENTRYFYDQKTNKAVFLYPAGRPWNDVYADVAGVWGPHMAIDWSTYCSTVARAGANYNYIWFAPWETSILHVNSEPGGGERSYREIWYKNDGAGNDLEGDQPKISDKTILVKGKFNSWSFFDQGRARRMDRILEFHEQNGIYASLNVWPHQALNHGTDAGGHPWGGEHGWAGLRPAYRNNGLSELVPGKEPIEFFKARGDSNVAIERKMWFYQQNYYRYLVARYGYSRSVAKWIFIDELEGVLTSDKGWWLSKKFTDGWHEAAAKFFKSLDYRERPLTSSTTYFFPGRVDNVLVGKRREKWWKTLYDDDEYWYTYDGAGGSHPRFRTLIVNAGKTPLDFVASHPYLYIRRLAPDAPQWGYVKLNFRFPEFMAEKGMQGFSNRVWRLASARMVNWSWNLEHPKVPGEARSRTMPRHVTEIAAWERNAPGDPVSLGTPNTFHFSAWGALLSGHAGVPVEWNDGKEFGEMFPRGSGVFSKASKYPDSLAVIKALKGFLGKADLAAYRTWNLQPVHQGFDFSKNLLSPTSSTFPEHQKNNARRLKEQEYLCLLMEAKGKLALGWVHKTSFSAKMPKKYDAEFAKNRGITIVVPAGYRKVEWYDSWTGKPVKTMDVKKAGAKFFIELVDFPETKDPNGQLVDGLDVAFKLVR